MNKLGYYNYISHKKIEKETKKPHSEVQKKSLIMFAVILSNPAVTKHSVVNKNCRDIKPSCNFLALIEEMEGI